MTRASQDSKHFAPSLAQNKSHEVVHTDQLTVLYARVYAYQHVCVCVRAHSNKADKHVLLV